MSVVRAALRQWHVQRLAEAESAAAAGIPQAFPFQIYDSRHVHACFRVLYALCKTRGAKTVLKFLPHEVADLEPAVQALVCQASGPPWTRSAANKSYKMFITMQTPVVLRGLSSYLVCYS